MLSIEIRDDGRGVDLERIRSHVVARNMASEAMAALRSSAELLEFLFLPASSRKETASAIAGQFCRGFGRRVLYAITLACYSGLVAVV